MSEFSLGRYKTEGSGGKEKEAILEEDDDLWVKMQHKHIADVIEYVNKQQTQLVGFFEGGKVFELFSRNTGSSECGLQYRLYSVK